MDLQYIDIDLLKPENRFAMKGISVTALDRFNVRHKGLNQPVFAYPNPNTLEHESYLMFSGLTTWLIAQEAEFQFDKVPVLIYEKPYQVTPQISGSNGLTSVDQTLDVIDEAKLLQQVLDENTSLSIAELARQIDRKRSDLSNQLRLLKLPIEIRNWIKQGKLSTGAGRALITLNDERKQITLAKEVMQKKLSMRVLEQRMRGTNSDTVEATPKNVPTPIQKTTDPNVLFIENLMSQKLGTAVNLRGGKLIIDYCDDLDVLQGLIQKMGLLQDV